MIEPYETVVTKIFSSKFSSLGLLPISNSNFEIVLSDGTQSLVLSTESRYQPALSITIINSSGARFELGTVKKILAPVDYANDLHILKSNERQYLSLIKEGRLNDAERQLAVYVTTAVRQVVEFLADYWKPIFTTPPTYLAQYALQEKTILSLFGIKN